MRTLKSSFLVLIVVTMHSYAYGTWSANVTVETRIFTDDPDSADSNTNFAIAPSVQYENSFDNNKFKLDVLGRADLNSSNRNIFIPKEAWWSLQKDSKRLYVGMIVESWSFLEVFNPADGLNSRNLDSEIEEAEKIGELAVKYRFRLWKGFLSLYYLPYFYSPTFPPEDSQLNPIPGTLATEDSVYMVKDNEFEDDFSFTSQYGFRLTQTFGDTDLAVHFLSHIDREQPAYAFDGVNNVIQPIFFQSQKFGIAGSHILGDYLMKFDWTNKVYEDFSVSPQYVFTEIPNHSVAALGAEYNFDTDKYSHTVFTEYQSVLGVSDPKESDDITFFQNDVLVGYRLNFNDRDGKELKLLSITDVSGLGESIWNLSFSSRAGSNWKLNTGIKGISAPTGSNGNTSRLTPFDRTKYFFINLTRYI